MTLLEKLSDVRDFRKILETTVKEIGENYSAEVSQIVLSNPLDSNFTSICEYIANPDEIPEDLNSKQFPLHLEGGGLGILSVSRQNSFTPSEINEIRISLADISDILRYAQINDIVQRDTFRGAFMSEINNLMTIPMGLGDALFMVVNILGKALNVSRCIFICVDDSRTDWRSYEFFQRERVLSAQEFGWPTKDSAIVAQALLSAVPITNFEGQLNSYKIPVQDEMEFIGVRSQLAVAIRSSISVHGVIILQQCESRHAWTRGEIDMVQSAADTIAEALALLPEEKKGLEPIMRLHQHEVAETKDTSKKSMGEVRRALKGAMRTTSIAKAQSSKKPSAEPAATPPPAPARPPEQIPVVPSDMDFQPEYGNMAAQASTENAFAQTQDLQSQYEAQPVQEDLGGWGQSAAVQEETAFTQESLGGWGQGSTEYPVEQSGAEPALGGELGGLADMLAEQAKQAEPDDQYKGRLNNLLGTRQASGALNMWDEGAQAEQPEEVAQEQFESPAEEAPAQAFPTPGSIAAAGDHNAFGQQQMGIGEPMHGGMVPGAKPASKWGDLDSIGVPSHQSLPAAQAQPPAAAPPPVTAAQDLGTPSQPAGKAASKWGDLDSIGVAPARPASPGPVQPSPSAGFEPGLDSLDSIPTPSAPKAGLGAMMMGKAKANAVASGSGLGGSFHKGGVKPPAAPTAFVDGPPIQIDEAAAELKLKQILASSNPTSDYIFAMATLGLDMRLLGRIDGWVSQVERKDKHVHGHARSVSEYSTAVARLMQLTPEEVTNIKLAAVVHDIGKMGLPEMILKKPDEELTDQELLMTMQHTIKGAELLATLPELAPLAPIVHAHHEEYNGNGYPGGLMGEDIPLASRIIHACNAYTEMVTDLVYRAGMAPEQAQNEMIKGAGSTYDPNVVEALIACISQGLVPPRID